MKNSDVELSIIIPVHNAENYIEECLNSLVGQSYRNFEIVIVDDKSSDRSVELVNTALCHSGLSYCICRTSEQNKRGVSAARNIGIERARGKYISFIDADDYVDYGLYEQLMGGIADYDFVYCRNDRIMQDAPFNADHKVTEPVMCKLLPREYITGRGKIWGG